MARQHKRRLPLAVVIAVLLLEVVWGNGSCGAGPTAAPQPTSTSVHTRG